MAARGVDWTGLHAGLATGAVIQRKPELLEEWPIVVCRSAAFQDRKEIASTNCSFFFRGLRARKAQAPRSHRARCRLGDRATSGVLAGRLYAVIVGRGQRNQPLRGTPAQLSGEVASRCRRALSTVARSVSVGIRNRFRPCCCRLPAAMCGAAQDVLRCRLTARRLCAVRIVRMPVSHPSARRAR